MLELDSTIISAAQAGQREFLVPASVQIGQFGVESGWGKHMPPGSNNPFGIKSYDGSGVVVSTREVDKHGQDYYIKAEFRKFASIADAFKAHAKLLGTAPIYHAALLAWSQPPYDLTKGISLMAMHYATDPHYAAVLLSIIHSNNLQQYDRV